MTNKAAGDSALVQSVPVGRGKPKSRRAASTETKYGGKASGITQGTNNLKQTLIARVIAAAEKLADYRRLLAEPRRDACRQAAK